MDRSCRRQPDGQQQSLRHLNLLWRTQSYFTSTFGGEFDAYVWRFVSGRPKQNAWRELRDLPATSVESDALSKDLIRRGFKFVGSTICYAFMQAVGMVNDHTTDCFRYAQLA